MIKKAAKYRIITQVFSKKGLFLSRGHVVAKTYLNFGFSKGGLKAQWST